MSSTATSRPTEPHDRHQEEEERIHVLSVVEASFGNQMILLSANMHHPLLSKSLCEILPSPPYSGERGRG